MAIVTVETMAIALTTGLLVKWRFFNSDSRPVQVHTREVCFNASVVCRCRVILAVFAVLAIGTLLADIAPRVSIKELVDSSDLIIVGKVERVQQTGTGTVTLNGRNYSRRDFEAEMSVDQIIKGKSVPPKFVLTYSTPAMDASGNVADGGLFANVYRVVFLKQTPIGYAFASPYTTSLPASPASCGPNWPAEPEQGAYQEVLQAILQVLCTSSDLEEKRLALYTLNWDQDSSAAPFLKAAVALPDVKTDPVLRTSIIGDLLEWKDPTALSLAEDDLFLPSQNTEAYLKSNLLLAVSSLDPKLSVPVLTRALKLPEPEARVGAARFLEYTHSESALDPLLSALDDPDREVQFAVMQSLGNLTNQHYWRPQTTENVALWFDCLKHWHEFAALRHTREAKPAT